MLEAIEDRTVPSVTGHVYYDVDGGGSDNGDTDASGVSVLLFQNGGMMAGSTFTDSSGNYFFPNTPGVGDYVQVFPSYSHFAYSNAGSTNNVPVAGGGTADLGLRGFANEAGGQGTIAGQLWFDTDGDTTKDTGETTGPDSAMVELLFTDQSSATYTLGYVMSSSGGHYTFGSLWSGSSYKLHVGGPVPGGGTPFAMDTPASAPATGTTTTDVGVTLPVVTVEKISDGTEGGANGTFRFTRTGDLANSLTVSILPPGGTATVAGGLDYSLTGAGISGFAVTFAASSSTVDVTVSVANDGTSEPTETVVLTLDDGGNAYRVGAANTAEVNILDNDAQYVSVEKIDAAEGGAAGTLRFTRIGDLSSSLTVNYTVGGTATSGTDYTALSGTVTFAAGEASAEVAVTAADDNTYDPDETVTATVTSGTGYSVGDEDEAAVIIADSARLLFTLESVDGGIKYTIPWDEVDPEEATQSLEVSDFVLYIGGRALTSGDVTFTAPPTAEFEDGVFVGLTFEMDTSSVGGGFAYTSVRMTGGLDLLAQPLVGSELLVAAQKKQSAVILNFTDTYVTTGQTIFIKITFDDDSTVETSVFIDDDTQATDVLAAIQSRLNDTAGINATAPGNDRLTVKGTDKLLKSLEFSAGQDAKKRDPGIKYLKYKAVPTTDIKPTVTVKVLVG